LVLRQGYKFGFVLDKVDSGVVVLPALRETELQFVSLES
jgi:hypothetical protein